MGSFGNGRHGREWFDSRSAKRACWAFDHVNDLLPDVSSVDRPRLLRKKSTDLLTCVFFDTDFQWTRVNSPPARGRLHRFSLTDVGL